jgi:phosphoribosylaminoimidazole (AIR) synthetase
MKNLQLSADAKESASTTFAGIIEQTRDFLPEAKYRPQLIQKRGLNSRYAVDAHPHKVFVNGDGIGTKPELAERLFSETQNYDHFTTLAHDGMAMVVDDAARDGNFVLGILNTADVNSASDPQFVQALAQGLFTASQKCRVPILNGETAELGYRSPGYGTNRINWNMGALTLVNEEKIIDGSKLKAGQPLVAFREKSIRSNGLTRARAILERAYLNICMQSSKEDAIITLIRHAVKSTIKLSDEDLMKIISSASPRLNILEQFHLPWHQVFDKEAAALLEPSTIYYPAIYEALGGIDGEIKIPLTGCAHISGGGVPLKGKRMVEPAGLGLQVEKVFPDPIAIEKLINLAQAHPDPKKGPLVDNRSASEQWNRGIGFLCATETLNHAEELVKLANKMGYEAALAGKVIAKPEIQWRDETWKI